MNLKETYNRIAEDWYRDHQSDDWWVEGTEKFISLLNRGDTVLDVGCGAGTKSMYLLKNGLKVTGIDFSENMIAIAKREVPGALFHVLDLTEIDTLKGNFEGIFMQAVLLHIPKNEASACIAKITKKLKSNGYFYLAVKGQRLGGVEEEVKVENDYGYPFERFFSYYTLSEIKTYYDDAGLTVIYENQTSAGKTTWVQVIGRKA